MGCCPYPAKCVYDDFGRCGVHFCVRPVCVYPGRCIELINAEINRVIVNGRPGWENRYAVLKAERDRLLRAAER